MKITVGNEIVRIPDDMYHTAASMVERELEVIREKSEAMNLPEFYFVVLLAMHSKSGRMIEAFDPYTLKIITEGFLAKHQKEQDD